MSGFKKDKSPVEMVELLKQHLGEWTTQDGKPTYHAAAQFLNNREAFSARGAAWSGQTLFLAMQRYNVQLHQFIPAMECPWSKPLGSREIVTEANRERVRVNNEIFLKAFKDWAFSYTLKIVPSAGQMARELNRMGSTTVTGRMWAHATVLNTLVQLGYEGQIAFFLESLGWVAGKGWDPELVKAYERECRKEAMRPRYEKIVEHGLDTRVPETLNQQIQLIAIFEGITHEEAVLKYSRVPYDILEAISLLGDEVVNIESIER